jgi:hypothetical protein
MKRLVPNMKAGAIGKMAEYELRRLESKVGITENPRTVVASDGTVFNAKTAGGQSVDLQAAAYVKKNPGVTLDKTAASWEVNGKTYGSQAEAQAASHEVIRDAMAKVVDSVDNRMGQLIYDNLFWNKAVKDLGMASVRSLGWNLGDIREIGGGAVDSAKFIADVTRFRKPDVTHRMAYLLALPTTVGMIGGAMTYLMTGKVPQDIKDYFYPRTGNTDEQGDPERVSLPSYMKDIMPLVLAQGVKGKVKTAETMAEHKLHPLLNMTVEMLRNQDYYGTKIRNEDDPIVQQAKDVLKQVGKDVIPFGIQGLLKERDRGTPWAKAVAPLIGITPAPRYVNQTPAQQMMSDYYEETRPSGGRTKEQSDRSQLKAQIVRALKKGDPEGVKRLIDAAKTGVLGKEDFQNIKERISEQPVTYSFKNLPIDKALDVWDVANDRERALLLPVLQKKLSTGLQNLPPQDRVEQEKRAAKALGSLGQ